MNWRKINWRRVTIEVGLGIGIAAIAGYVLINVLQRMQEALMECTGHCTVLNSPLDTMGLLKVVFFCITVSLMCQIIIEAYGRNKNQVRVVKNGIHP